MTKRKIAQPDLIDFYSPISKKPQDLMGENSILKQLTKAIVKRALQAERLPTSATASMKP